MVTRSSSDCPADRTAPTRPGSPCSPAKSPSCRRERRAGSPRTTPSAQPQTPVPASPTPPNSDVCIPSSGRKLTDVSRVEERRGSPSMTAPFPLPLIKPDVRVSRKRGLASSHSTRRRARWTHAGGGSLERAEYRLVVEAVSAARRHLMTSNRSYGRGRRRGGRPPGTPASGCRG